MQKFLFNNGYLETIRKIFILVIISFYWYFFL